jgi:hypothetical protein
MDKAGQVKTLYRVQSHRVSAIASNSKPAKLVAAFVVDANETELTIPFGN